VAAKRKGRGRREEPEGGSCLIVWLLRRSRNSVLRLLYFGGGDGSAPEGIREGGKGSAKNPSSLEGGKTIFSSNNFLNPKKNMGESIVGEKDLLY